MAPEDLPAWAVSFPNGGKMLWVGSALLPQRLAGQERGFRYFLQSEKKDNPVRFSLSSLHFIQGLSLN